MIRQELDIDGWWSVTVFYLPVDDDMPEVIETLREAGCPRHDIRQVLDLFPHKLNKGVTWPGYRQRHSVTVIGRSSSWEQFFDTLLHEINHLVDIITDYYWVANHGEPPAYLQGEIGRQMASAVKFIACPCCGMQKDQI